MNERIINLAKKLKALADRGVDGEKDNAIVMLQGLMEKHGITMEMIEGNEEKEHTFIVEKDHYKLWRQIVASVLGKTTVGCFANNLRGKRGKTYFVTCAPDKAIEIQARFDFFNKVWEEEFDVFYSAFIQKNKLYQKPSGEDKNEDENELTPEEKARLLKMFQMMESMTRHHFVKQLPTIK